jgi:hypothetical protein
MTAKKLRYTYLSIYEGHVRTEISYGNKKEALAFWTGQADGIKPFEKFRYVLRDNKTAKNIKDTWYPAEVSK